MIEGAIFPLDAIIENLESEPGVLFRPENLKAIKLLYVENQSEYFNFRAKVKQSKQVPMAQFDKLTKVELPEPEKAIGLFPAVTPYWDEVDGAELLDDLVATIRRFIIADPETIQAAALWCVFTWFVDSVKVCPIANITAPEMRCGKSEFLSVLAKLSCRPLSVSQVSPSALFRCIEAWRPTLLIDEVDAFLKDNEEARGILNSGFTRENAQVIRCTGDDHTPTAFNVWGAKALCGIGKIADTLADRSIPLRLRRKKPEESIERLRHSDSKLWNDLASRIARFAEDNSDQIEDSIPEIIPGLNDRANDCWEPLLSIAKVAGRGWVDVARKAAIALHGVEEERPTVGVELLRDIKSAFDTMSEDRLFTVELVDLLASDDEQPWATWNRGKPMTPKQLSQRLADFGIKSKQIRRGSESGKKGFRKSDFEDAWMRYIPPEGANPESTGLHSTDDAACSDFLGSTEGVGVDREEWL